MQFANPITDSAFRLRPIFIDGARIITLNTRLLTKLSTRGGRPYTITVPSGRTLDKVYSEALKQLQDDFTQRGDTLLLDEWSDVAAAIYAGLSLGCGGSGPITLSLVGTGCSGYTPSGTEFPIVYVG